MNKKIYLWLGIVLTILISYGIAWLTFVLDMKIDAVIKWGEILSDGTTFASRLSVPVVLAIWSHNKSISDKIELKRKEDKEYIQTYIEKYLEPLTPHKYEFEEENLKKILGQFSIWFLYLRANIEYLSYSYMDEYFYLLHIFTKNIKESNHLSMEELEFFYGKLSAHILMISPLLLLDEKKYKEEIPQTMDVFIDDKGAVRDITLEVLKDFPEYHEYALKYIEEQKQQQQAK